MNRNEAKINLKFDRGAAHRKSGYKKELLQAVKQLVALAQRVDYPYRFPREHIISAVRQIHDSSGNSIEAETLPSSNI